MPLLAWAQTLSKEAWAQALASGHGPNGEPLPPNPPEAIQSMYVGASGYAAYLEAGIFIDKMKTSLLEAGLTLQPHTQVLDCGVGWGRLYRTLLRDVHPSSLLGIDVDADVVEICRQAMPNGRFEVVDRQPPYSILESTSFDLVYLYSVFSHLSETAFRGMIAELNRIIKPGGFLVFTTLIRAHLNVWNAQVNSEGLGPILNAIGFDLNQWEQKADQGEFLYVPTGGGHPSRPADYYGEAILTEAFLKAAESELGFRLRVFDKPEMLPQAFVMMQKI